MLSTNLANLKLKNPTVLVSGIWGNTAGLLKRAATSGAGAVTTKSVSLEPRNGHENPCVVELKTGLLNAMGLPNPGVEEFKKELVEYKNFKHVKWLPNAVYLLPYGALFNQLEIFFKIEIVLGSLVLIIHIVSVILMNQVEPLIADKTVLRFGWKN